MPIYTYIRASTGEMRDVLQKMNDVHEYHGEDGKEDDWRRVFHIPNTSIDSQFDPYDNEAFVRKTGEKQGTVGDMLDLSKELSDQRAEANGGEDPVKTEYFKNYSKTRKGAKHPESKKVFENKDVKVEY